VAVFVLHCRCDGESPPPTPPPKSDGQQIHILKLFGGWGDITHGGQSEDTQNPQTTKSTSDTRRSVCPSAGRSTQQCPAVGTEYTGLCKMTVGVLTTCHTQYN